MLNCNLFVINNKRKRVVSAVILLVTGLSYLLFERPVLYRGAVSKEVIHNHPTHSSPVGWLIYDGGSWSIAYPPTLTIRKSPVTSDKILFEGIKDNTIGINFNPLHSRPEGQLVVQMAHTMKTDVLTSVLILQQMSIKQSESASDLEVVASKKVLIGDVIVVQFIYRDKSDKNERRFKFEVQQVSIDGMAE